MSVITLFIYIDAQRAALVTYEIRQIERIRQIQSPQEVFNSSIAICVTSW